VAGSRALTVLLSIVSIVAALAAYVFLDHISLLTATATGGRSAVWVNTPHVAPGDDITIDVVVKGGKKLGIESVIVRTGERELTVTGEGRTWGSSITSRRSSSGQDDVELVIQVPTDARPGDRMALTIVVDWVAAESDGVGSFENTRGSDTIALVVPIRTPAMRVLYKLRSAVWALALLGFVCALIAWLGKKLGPTLSNDSGNAESLGLLLIVGAMAYGFVGYGWFALPLVGATGIVGAWFVVLSVLLWLALPIYVAVKLARRADKLTTLRLRTVAVPDDAPYRAAPETPIAPDRTVEPRSLDEVIAAVRVAGLTVKPRRKGFDIRKAGHVLRVRVADPARIDPRAMTIVTDHIDLNFDLAFALVPLFGAIAANTGSVGDVVIDGRRTRAEVDAEVAERIRALAQRILDATQSLMDGIARKLKP
jgi:hypothetical protein